MMSQKLEKALRSGNLANLALILVSLLLVSACVFSSGRDLGESRNAAPAAATPEATPEATVADAKTDAPATAKKEDRGDFLVEHPGTKNPRYELLDQKIRTEKLLEKAADDLNHALSLPADITLRTMDCGTANAEFDPNAQTITVCFELMEHFYTLYRSDGIDAAKADQMMFDAVRFVFLHEVGHALIHNYRLPIMGNEEDAADRCSSYINIEELGDEGVRAVLAAADAFRIESRDKSPTGRELADEHLLQEQRFYNSLCMIYGADRDKYEYFVTDGYLPKERAVRCPGEYQRTVESWKSLLEPWRKDK